MTKAKYEKPQKMNPHKLTIMQHVLPLASIDRFVDSNGNVSLHDKARNRVRSAKADDVIFCAKRAWDQRAEAGYMKRIEDAFQALVLKIIDGTVSTISSTENVIVNELYALWYVRARHRNLATQEIQLKNATGQKRTQDEEESLEKNGLAFIREDGTMPARQINSMQIQRWIDAYTIEFLSAIQWGIIQAQEGQFVVPDVPVLTVIPLNPTLCLISPAPNGKQNVAEINRSLSAASQEYFFANDLSKCPF